MAEGKKSVTKIDLFDTKKQSAGSAIIMKSGIRFCDTAEYELRPSVNKKFSWADILEAVQKLESERWRKHGDELDYNR